jgi:hypothetical protein
VLGDFLCDDSNVVSSYFCSEGSGNIESEILDAVRDDGECLQKDESQQSCKHEIYDTESNTVQKKLEDLSVTGNKVDLPMVDDVSLKGLQESENCKETNIVVETEMQEILSYTVAMTDSSSVEADTRLESPRRCVLDSHDSSRPVESLITKVNESNTVSEATVSVEEVVERNKITFAKEDTKIVEMASPEPVNELSHSEAAVDEIRPFTEAQLSYLYTNQELDMNAEFVSEFVENHLHDGRQQHRLYELLVSYLRARNRLIVNAKDLEALKKECEEHQNNLWMVETSVVSESGECQDGNPVSASHEYRVSRLSKMALSSLNRTLTSVRELVNEVHSLNSYSSEVLMRQIEHYIQSVAHSCPEFERLPHNAPVNLCLGEPPPHTAACILELRMCIAILFTFQRRLIKDAQFVSDTRNWLSHLVAVLLRVASWRDHLFILNHVLRCPADVGSWAASYVQAPAPSALAFVDSPYSSYPSPFSSSELDHMVAMLATILLPVREREHFVEQVIIIVVYFSCLFSR